MGHNFALELSAMSEMEIDSQIFAHLRYNFYPPITSSMVIPCVEAIEAYNEEDINREIEMPLGVSYRGKDTAPAWAIVEQHRLDPWLSQDDDYYEEYEYQDL